MGRTGYKTPFQSKSVNRSSDNPNAVDAWTKNSPGKYSKRQKFSSQTLNSRDSVYLLTTNSNRDELVWFNIKICVCEVEHEHKVNTSSSVENRSANILTKN